MSYCQKTGIIDNTMQPGTYELSPQGYRVFIPDPLPPKSLNLSLDTLKRVEEATYRLGQVEMCRTLLPNPELLIYSSLQREAIASSTIEGTIAEPGQLALFQLTQRAEKEAVKEVDNYRRALEWGIASLDSLPLSTRLIQGLHQILMEDVRGQSYAGEFKRVQNYIGPHSYSKIEEATFIPTPPDRVPALMSDLERYIHSRRSEPKVVQCALVHYQFETIHPFSDGNGRVGRLLIILQLISLDLLSAPLIYPSVYFEHTRSQYYQYLQQTRESGDWDTWISYFVAGLSKQCQLTLDFTKTILQMKEELKKQITGIQRSSISITLDCFFEKPVLTISELAQRSGLSRNTVKSAIDSLQMLGIVQELGVRLKRRAFTCIPLWITIFPDSELSNDWSSS